MLILPVLNQSVRHCRVIGRIVDILHSLLECSVFWEYSILNACPEESIGLKLEEAARRITRYLNVLRAITLRISS